MRLTIRLKLKLSASLISGDRGFLLIGDLHANLSQFAVACEEGGADGVMLHLNENSPQGSRFGGLEIEEEVGA